MNETIDDILDDALAYVHESRADLVRDEINRLRRSDEALERVQDIVDWEYRMENEMTNRSVEDCTISAEELNRAIHAERSQEGVT